MATKKSAAKSDTARTRSAAAKKAAETRKKNAAAKKQAAVQAAADRPPGAVGPQNLNPEVTRIAQEAVVKGSRWGSGRERDAMVRAAGHDPAAVRAEIHRIQAEQRANG